MVTAKVHKDEREPWTKKAILYTSIYFIILLLLAYSIGAVVWVQFNWIVGIASGISFFCFGWAIPLIDKSRK